MRSELDRFDRSQPALIITYGNTTRKVRPLDRDVLMLGRAPGCDVQVKSPDIFPVHLLILRVADGWRLRDCTGRGSTQLNGRPVQDELLRDGDVVQVSTFSFLLHLPGPRKPPVAQMAPRQTENVLDSEEDPAADGPRLKRLQRSRERLAQRALALRKRHQEAQALCAQLQQSLENRDACIEDQQREVDALLRDMKARVKQLEQKETDFQGRRKALEQELTTLREQSPPASEATVPPLPSGVLSGEDNLVRRLQIRVRELESYVRHLRRHVAAVRTTPEGASLKPGDVASLHQELISLQVVVNNLQEENDVLRARLKDWQENSQVWRSGRKEERSRITAEQEELRQRIRELERHVEGKVREVERLQSQLGRQNANPEDQEAYESELHRFRLDLERDREALNDQLALLQARSKEFDRTVRESEEHLVQQRAQLIRERAELERLHDQLRKDRDNGSADALIRSRIAHIQKVKEEIAQRQQAAQGGQNDHSTKLPTPSKQVQTVKS